MVDIENSIDWKRKFPNTKFKTIDELDNKDARIALVIILNTLKILSDRMSKPFGIITYSTGSPKFSILFMEKFEINELLDN